MAKGEIIEVLQVFLRGQIERLPGRFNGSGLKREDPALDFVFYQTMPGGIFCSWAKWCSHSSPILQNFVFILSPVICMVFTW
jgi:hypothetical protein